MGIICLLLIGIGLNPAHLVMASLTSKTYQLTIPLKNTLFCEFFWTTNASTWTLGILSWTYQWIQNVISWKLCQAIFVSIIITQAWLNTTKQRKRRKFYGYDWLLFDQKSAFLLKNLKRKKHFLCICTIFSIICSFLWIVEIHTKKLKCFYNQQTYFSQIVSKKSQNNNIFFFKVPLRALWKIARGRGISIALE